MDENTTPMSPVKKQSSMGMLLMGIVIGIVVVLVIIFFAGNYILQLLGLSADKTKPYISTYTPSVPAAPGTSTTTTTTTTTPTAVTPAPASTTIQYDNSQYGFSLTLPKTWANYKVKTVTADGAVAYIYVEMPTTDDMPATSSNDKNYYAPFALGVYTPSQWAELESSGGPIDTVITKTSQYVFTWSHANGIPATDWKLDSDIKGIIASFKAN
jgi:hypothetical protein